MKSCVLLLIGLLMMCQPIWAQVQDKATAKQAQKAEKLFERGVRQKAWDEEKHSIYKDRLSGPAFEYYKEAADLGHAEACYRVAVHYEHGRGVEQNIQLMLAYFKRAADLGHTEAAYWYASKLESVPGISLGKVREVSRYYEMCIGEGKHFTKKSGLSRYVVINRLAIYYLNYLLDYNRAFSLLKEVEQYKAKSADELNCKTNLAWCYFWGRGCEKDVNKGFKLFDEVWEMQKNALAGSHLAYAYYSGYGTAQNDNKVWEVLNRLADNELTEVGNYTKGCLYYYGRGTSTDPDKARKFFTQAANEGFEPAQKMLANMSRKN